jgi:hypothetical protein
MSKKEEKQATINRPKGKNGKTPGVEKWMAT